MATRAVYDYTKCPSRSAQELYGENMIVHVWQRDDNWFACPSAFLVPRTMAWRDFYATMVLPLVAANPHTTGHETYTWTLVDAPFTPQDEKSLEELGVEHKNTLGFARV